MFVYSIERPTLCVLFAILCRSIKLCIVLLTFVFRLLIKVFIHRFNPCNVHVNWTHKCNLKVVWLNYTFSMEFVVLCFYAQHIQNAFENLLISFTRIRLEERKKKKTNLFSFTILFHRSFDRIVLWSQCWFHVFLYFCCVVVVVVFLSQSDYVVNNQ